MNIRLEKVNFATVTWKEYIICFAELFTSVVEWRCCQVFRIVSWQNFRNLHHLLLLWRWGFISPCHLLLWTLPQVMSPIHLLFWWSSLKSVCLQFGRPGVYLQAGSCKRLSTCILVTIMPDAWGCGVSCKIGWAGIAQLVVCWSRCHAWCSVTGSISEPPVEGIFSPGVIVGSDTIP